MKDRKKDVTLKDLQLERELIKKSIQNKVSQILNDPPEWFKMSYSPGFILATCKWKSHGGGISAGDNEAIAEWLLAHSKFHHKKR